ncbi:MAG: hypothetical protein QOJ32_2734 [Frankiaceae bacterium]|nr:hypothetical protein [Frankiaceae bacterium]
MSSRNVTGCNTGDRVIIGLTRGVTNGTSRTLSQ